MTFTAAMDLRAAGTFIERACWLVEPHRSQIPGLGFYLDQLTSNAAGLRVVSNNSRAVERADSLRLFS